MIQRFGKSLMYAPDIGSWFIWNGNNWRKALGGRAEIEHFAKETVRGLAAESSAHEDNLPEFYQFCAISQRAQMVANMVKLAESDPRVVVPSYELDKFSHFLGVKNGVVDLRSGALLPADPKMRITLTAGCNYDPEAKCPVFEQTLREVFFDDADMVEYVTRTFGYALLGEPKEDIMFIAFGNGANGKSTVFNAVREAFGAYARSADASSFVSDSQAGGAGGAREDLVRLRGARFVYVNEPDENGELREGVVKGMTGGDAITARGLYAKDSVEFMPTWTVFMPTNHKPIIKGNDNGIWRRMGMLPFERNFEADATLPKDKKRKEKLRAEMPGILTLVVQAAIRYAKNGLTPPARVLAARDSYRAQMDLLAEWLDECCDVGNDQTCTMRELWESWESFARSRGMLNYIRSSAALSRRLDSRFPAKRGTGGVRTRIGVSVRPPEMLF
jgi:P4 family phage/plasmid primase-like protien